MVGTSNYISNTVWGKCFLDHQYYIIQKSLVNQDNQRVMEIERNVQRLCGQKSRHYHRRYFYIKYLVDRKDIDIEYCPTDDMVADFLPSNCKGSHSGSLKI